MWRRVVWSNSLDVSEEPAAAIFRAKQKSSKVHSLGVKNVMILQLRASLLYTYKEMYCGISNNLANGRSSEWNSCVCIAVQACSSQETAFVYVKQADRVAGP